MGKTTLFKEVSRLADTDELLTSAQAKRKMIFATLWDGASFKEKLRILVLSGLRQTPSTNGRTALDALSDRLEEYQPLFALCWSRLAESEEPVFLRMKKISWLMEIAEEVAMLEASGLSQGIIFDESLSQKLLGWIVREQDKANPKIKLPLPRVFVHVAGTPALAIERLGSRKKKALEHRFMNDQELEISIASQIARFKEGADWYTKMGIPGITIDSSLPLQEKAQRVLTFLRSET